MRKEIVDSDTPQLLFEDSMKGNICPLKILLENDIVKAVTDDDGKTLQKLQKDTNSIMTISEEFKYYPGTTEHKCSIMGTTDALLKALFCIIDIKKINTPRGSEVQMKFVVSDSTAKMISGEKEKNIQQIKTKSKAYMRMYRKKDYPSPNESCFVVRSYDVEFIKMAFSLILDYITINPENVICVNIINSDVSLPAVNYGKTPINKDSSLCIDNENLDSKDVRPSQENSKEDKICHLKILLDTDIADTVIVVGGESLQKLQKETNSIATISKEIDHFPGTSKRVCSIAGNADTVLKALVFIIYIIEVMALRGGELLVEFVVPDSTAGLIIGEKEENIQQIRIKSKANVLIYNKEDYPSIKESCLVVKSGAVENIKTAFSLILEQIALDPENGSCFNTSYPDVSIPTPNSEASKNKDNSNTDFFVADQEILNWNDHNFKMHESCVDLPSNAASEYPATINQVASNNLSKPGVDEYSSKYTTSRYPEWSVQLANSSEVQRVNNYESGSQFASLYPVGDNQISSRSRSDDFDSSQPPSNDSGYEYHLLEDSLQRHSHRRRSPSQYHYRNRSRDRRSQSQQSHSVSPMLRSSTSSPRKEVRSRTRSIEYQPLSPHKKSCKNSRSKSGNYKKRSKSHSRSRSYSRDREYNKYNKRNPLKSNNKFIHRDSNKSGNEFSLSGALNFMERVCDKCGALSGSIKAFTTTIKSELKIDRNEALRLLEDGNSILLLRMTEKKLKSCIASASSEEIGMLSKAAKWTNYLIEYVEKAKKPEKNINFKAIAEASLNKTPDFIHNLIRTVFLYEGKFNPTTEDLREAFVKVTKLQLELGVNDK